MIARYAASGTGIEYGWSTLNGITLARATTGYEEGEITPAGEYMRDWLNSLGANAGAKLIRRHRRRSWGSEVTSRGMSDRACTSASSSAVAASASIGAPCPTSSIDGR